jgi:predicted phage terminase large subunit-like protein
MNNNPYDSISEIRKEMGRRSLKFFMTNYCGQYIKYPFSPYHLEMINYLEKMTFERSKKVAWAAPRGNAKSSIVTTMYVLWCTCYRHESCIVIFSETKEQSEKMLGQIRDGVESLQEPFSDVYAVPNPRWRRNEIVTKNGVNVVASSTGHRIRGIRYKHNRPGLVILDDAETRENTQTLESREKIHDWFSRVVLNLGSKHTNYVVVGTVLHTDSLLARLTSKAEFPGFDAKVFKSVIRFSDNPGLWDVWAQIYRGKESYGGLTGPEAAVRYYEDNKANMLKGTAVLWPEHEGYYDLMVTREQIGHTSFDSEKMNEPKDLAAYSVDEKALMFWDTDQITTTEELRASLGGGTPIAAIDPSTGKGKDYSAIVGAIFLKGKIYVTDVEFGRWDLLTIVKRVCLHQQQGKYVAFAYESNGFQKWLGESIKKEPIMVPLKPVTNLVNKEGRIWKVMLFIQKGLIIFSRRHRELISQITSYPNVANEDILDALSMIVDIAENLPQERVEQLKGELKKLTVFKKLGFPKIGGFKMFDPKKKIILRYDPITGTMRPPDDPFGLLSAE